MEKKGKQNELPVFAILQSVHKNYEIMNFNHLGKEREPITCSQLVVSFKVMSLKNVN